jgi:hypothetical protein
MESNHENLEYLYRRIAVLEMVEKLKNCALTWNQIAINQYHINMEQNGHIWDMYLTKQLTSEIVLDFSRDGKYFYSLNSETENGIVELYEEIEGDEYFNRDKKIMRHVQTLDDCR